MDDDVHAIHGPSEAVPIADVPDEVPDARVIESVRPHLVLFELVAAEDDEFPNRLLQDDLGELLAEGSRAARNQDSSILPEPIPSGAARRHYDPQTSRMI